MKDRSTADNKSTLLSGENRKSRMVIIVASLLAFAGALLLYFLLNIDDKPILMADTPEGAEPDPAVQTMVEYPHVPGRIMLRIRPEYRAKCSAGDISIDGLRDIFQELGASSIRKNFPQAETIIGDQRNDLGQALVDLSLIYEIQCDTTVDIYRATALLSGHPAVEYAEPRFIYETFLTTNDLYLSYQWYLDSMRVQQAWDQSTGDTSIVIAIIDTGTDFGHNDLDGDRIAYNYADPIDGVDNDNDGFIDNFKGWDFGGASFWSPADNNPNWVGNGPGMDHGVLVAGVACAEANNGKGIAGAGYHTRYLPLKASVDQSLGISYGMDAIVYAADHGADILNLSWGSGAFSQFGQNIIDYAAVNKGCLLVAASGNQFTNTFIYPASYKNVLSTAATQTGDAAWDQGTGTGTTYNYLVDICAPGRNLITTTGGNSYWSGATGTSMSAPLVCALASLVKAKNPGMSSIQAGQVVRTTAEDIYANNPSLNERLGKGQADALAAVSAVNPKSVRLDDYSVYDGNNDIPESYDTLEVVARFVNYLSPTNNLVVDISSPNSEYIEVLNGSQTLGSIGPRDTASNAQPFLIHIKRNITNPTKLWLRFGFTDGNYTDYQYQEIVVYPNMIDLDANKLKTTINGMGNFGFVDFPGFQFGLGLQYDGKQNVIRDAGFLVGISQTNLVDGTRNDIGERDGDLLPTSKPYRQLGPQADREARAKFDDGGAAAQGIGIDVVQRAYQYSDASNDQYVIFEYVIRNTNNYPVNGAYAGLYAQWNRSFYNLSNANYYPGVNGVAANFFAGPDNFYTGMALLSEQDVHAFSTTESQFDFSSNSKFEALRYTAGGQNSVSGDAIQFVSAGPFNMPAGDSVVVAFALLGGDNLADLEIVSETARNKYHCQIKNRKPAVDLGSDVIVCSPGNFPQLIANASPGVSYAWSTGDTTANLLVVDPGIYKVTVTNAYGCVSSDTVEVFMKGITGLGITASGSDFPAGAPVGFTVPDPGNAIVSWAWDFGDGNTSTLPNPSHIFSEAGTYTVTVVISNGYCSDTLSYPVTVNLATSLNAGFAQSARFFPNPVQNELRFHMEYDFVGEVVLEIFDNAGKRVKQVRLDKNAFSLDHRMDVSGLSAGFYLAKVRAGELEHSDKIIKR